MSPRPLGVGVIGCGEAAQAIHLPTLARLHHRLRVVHCMDVDLGVAATVAARAGARASDTVDAVMDDPAVDVVVVCTPEAHHAEHVVAACRAGKAAVLCEKPLAASVADAQRIVDASSEHDVPVLVGTMHAHERALRVLRAEWGDLPARAVVVRSTTFLPPNPLLVAAATQPVHPPGGRPPPPSGPDHEVLRTMMLRLGVHDLQLLRGVLGEVDRVEVARLLPRGYHVALSSGNRTAHLTALFLAVRALDWSFEVIAADAVARVEFPASYLPGAGATATLRETRDGGFAERRVSFASNAYVEEWLHVEQVARREEAPVADAADALRDVALAHVIAAAATPVGAAT